MTYRIIAVSGGTGDPSNSTALAERILAAAREQLRLGGVDAEVEVIELRPLAHDLVDMTLTGIASEALETAFDRIRTSHGLVVAAQPAETRSVFDDLDPEAVTPFDQLLVA